MVIAPVVTDASPVALNVSVRTPVVPVMTRSVKVASPSASVTTLVVPLSAGAPLASATATETPACATGFPDASSSRTTGAMGKAAPFAALLDVIFGSN